MYPPAGPRLLSKTVAAAAAAAAAAVMTTTATKPMIWASLFGAWN